MEGDDEVGGVEGGLERGRCDGGVGEEVTPRDLLFLPVLFPRRQFLTSI